MLSTKIENSSNIANVAHDGVDLFVSMKHGKTYQYENCPEQHYHNILKADSPGKYFNSNVKENFPWSIVGENEEVDTSAPNTVKIVGHVMRGSEHAAGYDMFASESKIVYPHNRQLIKTGVSIAMPPHMCALVTPRSGTALKRGITVGNAPGLIDPDYRGEIGVIVQNHSDEPFNITIGDRVAQLLFVPFFTPNFIQVESLDETARGVGGFGSTGV